MKREKLVAGISAGLVVLGAVTLGIVGVFDYNIIEATLGVNTLRTVTYALIGVSGLLHIPAAIKAAKAA